MVEVGLEAAAEGFLVEEEEAAGCEGAVDLAKDGGKGWEVVEELVAEGEGDGVVAEGEVVGVAADAEGEAGEAEEGGEVGGGAELVEGDVHGDAVGGEGAGEDEGAVGALGAQLDEEGEVDALLTQCLEGGACGVDAVGEDAVVVVAGEVVGEEHLAGGVLAGELGAEGDLTFEILEVLVRFRHGGRLARGKRGLQDILAGGRGCQVVDMVQPSWFFWMVRCA